MASPVLEPEVDRHSVWSTFCFGAWSFSLLTHSAVLGALALITLVQFSGPEPDSFPLEWEEPAPPVEFVATEGLPSATIGPSGGSAPASAAAQVSETPRLTTPTLADDRLAPVTPATDAADLAEYVGALLGVGRGGNGRGRGTGDGDGFFGGGEGKGSFVFVLDRSASMNRPHGQSEDRTRFERLKMELITFLNRLTPSQKFFVIFFDEEPCPMPAATLVPATPENKARYMEWIATLESGGHTDPRLSLRMAMKLQPDIIYFLSDGEIDPYHREHISRFKTGAWTLNTFAFGNESSAFMKDLADKHGGQYTYIP